MSKPNVHGLPQHLRKDEGGYFLDFFVQEEGGRKRKRVRLGQIPLPQAKKVLAQHLQSIVENRYLDTEKPKITFNEAADSFMAYSVSRKKSFHRDKYYVASLKAFFGDKLLESLNLDLVEKFLNWRKKTGKPKGAEMKAATLNRDLACLKTIVNRAKLNREIERNPIEGIKLFKEIPRDRTLTQEEYLRLDEQCVPHLKPIVHIAFKVGMRRGELLFLRRDQVDYRNKVIVLEATDTKTQEKREIPLDDEMIGMLRRFPQTLGSPYVFTYKGKPFREIRTAFNSACKRAGLEGFHFHDLRHCAVTNMRKAGVPESVIMSITGHKTHSVFRRYDRIDRMDRKDALDKVRVFNDTKFGS